MLLPEERVAVIRKNKVPTTSQEKEAEEEQEGPPRKAPHSWGAMGGTSRLGTLQEVIPWGT